MNSSHSEKSLMHISAVVTAALALCGVLLVLLFFLATRPSTGKSTTGLGAEATGTPLRVALVPERDIFEQRRRYQILVDYLNDHTDMRIELVTLNSYQAVLTYLETDEVDCAFLGSLLTVLAYDRLSIQVLVKPVDLAGVDTYRGVFLVKPESGIETLDALRGRPVAMVATTTAGHLYPFARLMERGLIHGEDPVRITWAGTHDEAIDWLLAGQVEAAAVKDLRWQAYQRQGKAQSLLALETSESVPTNALVVREGVDDALIARIAEVLLRMDQDESGRAALAGFGAQRFERCTIDQYAGVFNLIDEIGTDWPRVGIPGEPPARPASMSADVEKNGD